MGEKDLEFDRAMTDYGEPIYRFVRQRLPRISRAEHHELTQDVFVELWKQTAGALDHSSTKSFENEDHKRRWLYRTAENKIRNRFRKKTDDAIGTDFDTLPEPDSGDDSQIGIERRLDAHLVYEAIKRLPKDKRIVVMAWLANGADHGAATRAAQELGMDPIDYRRVLRQAKERLKTILNEQGGETK